MCVCVRVCADMLGPLNGVLIAATFALIWDYWQNKYTFELKQEVQLSINYIRNKALNMLGQESIVIYLSAMHIYHISICVEHLI